MSAARLTLAAARCAAALLSPAGRSARLSILIFHRVRPEPDPLFPAEMTAPRFARLLDAMGVVFTLLPLPEAISRLGAGTLPARAASLTFDDGYRDNAEVALPLLRARGVHATFFVASGFLDGGRMWNDTLIEALRRAPGEGIDLRQIGLGRLDIGPIEQRRATVEHVVSALKHLPPRERAQQVERVAQAVGAELPCELMMSSAQVRELADAGMEIGGHTVTHPILARLSADDARREIEQGRAELRSITGRPVRLFAYPNGKPGRDYLPEHAALVREAGFEAALSTSPGVASGASDFYQLPRFTPWDTGDARFVWRAVANLRQAA